MPAPFKSTVFTGGSFAASGSNGHASAGLLIYSASRSVNGLLHPVDRLTIGRDIFVYVSGVRGSRGTTTPGTVLIDGDLLISGTAYDSAGNVLGSGGSSPTYFTSPTAGIVETTGSLVVDGNLVVQGTTTQIETVNLRVKDSLVLIGSGALGTNRNGGIALASGSATADQSLVWGRVANDTWGAGKIDVADGILANVSAMTLTPIRASKYDIGGPLTYLTASTPSQVTIAAPAFIELAADPVIVNGRLLASGFVSASLGLTGSLTRLPDGRSYLAAGANVTIASESNGQVTISAAGGSGSPGGSDTFVQFNDGGTFNGTGGLTFDKATGNLTVTGSLIASSSTGLFVLDGVQPTLTLRASTDTSNQALLYQESGGDTYLTNARAGGKLFSSVKTSLGVAVRYIRAIPNAVNYNTIVSLLQGLHDFFDPQVDTTDVSFYVGGKPGSKDTSGQRGTALFAGDLVVSGSSHLQGGGSITGSISIQGSIIPSADTTYTLGSQSLRWGHVYTGDLHLRNERGDWTILEEADFLCVINNRTGKRYKMMLQPID